MRALAARLPQAGTFCRTQAAKFRHVVVPAGAGGAVTATLTRHRSESSLRTAPPIRHSAPRQLAAAPSGIRSDLDQESGASTHQGTQAWQCSSELCRLLSPSTILPQGSDPWTAIFWFLIPLIMLITAITLAVVGIRHRKASTAA